MLRFLFIALLIINLSFALPTVSYLTTVTRRSDNSNNLAERGYKHKHTKKPHKYHTATTPANSCATGTAYYIQAAENNQYARLDTDADAPDAFQVLFDQDTTLTSTTFQFTVDANGLCRLSLFPTATLPNAASFLSYVADPVGIFNNPHPFLIIGPVLPDPDELTTTPIQCNKAADDTLLCSVTDPATALTEDVLNIAPPGLYISSIPYFGGSPIFNLIPVL